MKHRLSHFPDPRLHKVIKINFTPHDWECQLNTSNKATCGWLLKPDFMETKKKLVVIYGLKQV